MLSNLSSASVLSTTSDPTKVSVLFEKLGKCQLKLIACPPISSLKLIAIISNIIEKSNNLEIEERLLKNLA
jgi:hypothetical protein